MIRSPWLRIIVLNDLPVTNVISRVVCGSSITQVVGNNVVITCRSLSYSLISMLLNKGFLFFLLKKLSFYSIELKFRGLKLIILASFPKSMFHA